MKNIVLVTWIGSGNYGTTLQSFALHKKIEKLGYNVTFIRGIPSNFTIKNRIKYFLQLLHIDIEKIKRHFNTRNQSVKQQKLSVFIDENYNIYKSIYCKKQLKKLIAKTDVFVTGSDQIWNTVYKFNPNNFLDFAGDAKRIAYASSIGLQDFPEEHKPEVRRMLSKFSHIGLREDSAVKVVSRLLDRNDIIQVLDPTFLLDFNDWNLICNKARIEVLLPKSYILCYLIGNNDRYKEQLKDVIAKTGINNIIIIPAAENATFSIKGATIYDEAGPLEFVRLIQKAAFVCTDSFHATAISINLNIDFVEFIRFENSDKASQNSRIYDVLSHYGLMDRIYKANDESWSKKIDFSNSNIRLSEDRKKSLDYLVNSIEK